jgi:hypothetical protein
MTKSRIALSKINRSVLVRSGNRPSDFHRTAARFEPEKNTSGNTRSRSTADKQTNRVPQGVKRKSSGNADYSAYAQCSAPVLRSWLDRLDASPDQGNPRISIPKWKSRWINSVTKKTSPTVRGRAKKRTFSNGRQALLALRQPAAGRLHRREPIAEANPNSDGFAHPGFARRLHCEARAQHSVFGFHCCLA